MSNILVSDEGARNVLLDQTTLQAYTLRLFKNNLTADLSRVIGDFTEADFSGYASVAIGGWGVPVTVAGRAKNIANLCSFAHAGGAPDNDVYGYYVTSGGNLYWFEKFDTLIHMAPGSPPIQIFPVFTLRSEFAG